MVVLVLWCYLVFHKGVVKVIVFNATFNNISVISWWSVSLVEETRAPGENHWKSLSHNVVSSTPHLSGIRTHNVSDDRRWLHRYIHDHDSLYFQWVSDKILKKRQNRYPNTSIHDLCSVVWAIIFSYIMASFIWRNDDYVHFVLNQYSAGLFHSSLHVWYYIIQSFVWMNLVLVLQESCI